MIRRRYFLMLIVLFACTSLWAVAQPTAEELAQQRRDLDAVRAQPERLARLREHLNSYLKLPEKRQAAIVKLDHDLREAKEKRLWSALERYADWLEQQKPEVIKAIKDAPNATARLALIKEQRYQEWMSQQPKPIQDEWKPLKGEASVEFVKKLREEERQRQAQWVIAKRFWKELESHQPMPSKLADYSQKVQGYVTDYLMPQLTVAEKERLTSAEGRWPDYPAALVKIASKRPSALPPEAPRKFAQLPMTVQDKFKKADKAGKKAWKEIHSHENSPSFASKFVAIGLRENKLPFGHEYLAPNYASLLKPMKEFVDNKLIPALEQPEVRKLTDSEGKWPDYPKMIQDLSHKHSLQPPWHILPEPDRWKWDLYRDVKARSWGADPPKEKKAL